ncbi:hypothetical protein NC658_03090 [Streptomyces griseoincarnatus]|uniref:UL36 very large tegument protein n=1 Tax=Streptomyces griseoincarnatus TaxID=29305 RepID=A0ABT0VNK9_STRGI|nr:hypothetical protein [Streptomyces griseoincarnatus]MCM2512244.1 hypothetical protein [Streptomyces griseoincarnatus]
MAAEQLPDGVREFTDHLRGLLARLDRYAGWCLVFWQRDPEGMRACLEGREPPPWDVVESLLQDLAAVHGPAAAEAELPRARSLHAQATAAFDARPGALQTLGDHLDVMLREQRYAADRRAGLTRRLAAAANHEEAEALGNDLAWAEDDHRRATARCAELTARMTALDDRTRATSPAHTQGRFATRRTPDAAFSESRGAQSAPADRGRPSSATPPSPVQGRGPTPADRGHGSSSAAPARGSAPIREGQGLSSAGDGGGPASPGSGHGPTPADWAEGPSSAAPARGSAPIRGGQGLSSAGDGGGPASPGSGRGPTPADWAEGPSSAAPARGSAPIRGGQGLSSAGDGGGPASPGSGRGPTPADPSHRLPAPGSPHPHPASHAADRHTTAPPEAHPSPRAARQASDPRPHGHPAPPGPVPPELRAAQQHVPPPAPAEEARPAPSRKRRRGGARFAGVEDDGAAPLVEPTAAVPELPAATAARGARFAGAAAETDAEERPQERRPDAEGLREVAHLVRTLTRLRREGRSGDAHVLLNEAAYWPAVRFPLLAGEMERAGLAADWATLLWEAAATLPAERLVAASDALTAGGRAEDGEQILRQGVVRPAAEIGHAALALADGTRHRELRALLDACVRMRTPQDAARTAAPDPGRLVPLLLTAARGVSEERHWDVLHALRVAGLAA